MEAREDSILTSIKKLLGITEECEDFDADITMHINTVLSILTQIGVGPPDGFSILDKKSVWSDFITDEQLFASVKSYIFLKVKLLFDPPLSTAIIECYNRSASELEWRLNVEAENEEDDSND